MGYGSYSHTAHVAMTQARRKAPKEQVFKQRRCHALMDPKGVTFRESRDSPDHPNSVGIILALDVSGSMGAIPRCLATATLPDFMKILLDAGIPDPQILFMAVGQADGDAAPLQVGQFESTANLMDQWLTRMYLERGGAGGYESYELAMYFAAHHTAMDCWEKRGRKGFFFVTGDEPPNTAAARRHIARLIGDELGDDIPIGRVIDTLSETFEPFYLIPDPRRGRSVGPAWREVLGDRVIVMESPDDTGHVAAGLVALVEGAVDDVSALVARYVDAGLPRERAHAVARAITDFAASIDRAGTPEPALGTTDIPAGSGGGHDRG